MSVNYADDVASAPSSMIPKLLVRWTWSVFQALWLWVLFYVCAFVAVGLIYKFALIPSQQKSFENFSQHCDCYAKKMPLMIEFFTAMVIARWWAMFTSLPFTDKVINKACRTIIPTTDPTSVSIVQTIARYTILSWVLHMRIVSRPIRQKYPTLQSMESSGLLLPHETPRLEDADVQQQNTKPWLPIVWCTVLLRKAALEGRITCIHDGVNLLCSLEGFRKNCMTILKLYFTNVPLVAIQCVTLAVHAFGIAVLFGKQILDPNSDNPALVLLSFLPVLQYIGYLGLLKLAEILINPFGEGKDDFNFNKALEKKLERCAVTIKLYREQQDCTREETAESVVPEEAEHESSE